MDTDENERQKPGYKLYAIRYYIMYSMVILNWDLTKFSDW